MLTKCDIELKVIEGETTTSQETTKEQSTKDISELENLFK